MAPRFDCVCVGLSTVDVLALLDRRLREDEKLAAERIVVDGGGPAGTAACAAAACGLKAAVLSFVGRDLWTDFVLDGFRRFGVDTRFLQAASGMSTPVSLIAVNRRNASRTIIWNSQGAQRRRFSLPALLRRGLLDARCLHCDGHLMELSLRLARLARAQGILTSYDCGSVKPRWQELAALSDVFIASHKFTRQLGLSVPRAVRRLRRRFGSLTAVTEGEKGFSFFDEASGQVRSVPQRRCPALDTTGCGDVFHGAFLAHYLRERDFQAALVFAQAAAGRKTLRLGGRAGIKPARISAP
ncbi:MAG: PfkB family carbohydrate kinase [Elusimicrobia bacterium]|nr:PfkB family carbohydrate kinase [Elusimicrobiota bacterium]